jgi:hypothetical protein
MATLIRPVISEKSKYYIDKHRYYELKHFCLQYSEWKHAYNSCCEAVIFGSKFDGVPSSGAPGDLTAKYAIRRAQYAERISMIEKAAKDADDFLHPYILRAVTEGLSYTYLKAKMDMPCGRDMYYDRYRRFFWLLSEMRA